MHPTLCKHFLDKNRVTVWIIRFNSVSCRARLCRHSASSRTRRSRDEYSSIPISLSDTCTGGIDTPNLSNVPWHCTGWLMQQNLVRNRSGKQEMRTEWMLWKTMWQQLDQTQYFQYYMTIRILHATFQLSPGLRWDLDLLLPLFVLLILSTLSLYQFPFKWILRRSCAVCNEMHYKRKGNKGWLRMHTTQYQDLGVMALDLQASRA